MHRTDFKLVNISWGKKPVLYMHSTVQYKTKDCLCEVQQEIEAKQLHSLLSMAVSTQPDRNLTVFGKLSGSH